MLGIGRVTLQQTARILEQERLLRVQRGVNGGYYGTRPDEAGVEQAVAVYLRAKNSGFPETLRISGALSSEMLSLATLSNDENFREQLRKVGETLENAPITDGPQLVAVEKDFFDAVFGLAANPLGELMLRVTFRMYYNYARHALLQNAADFQLWRQTRLNMVRAILNRDHDYVQLLSRRFDQEMQKRAKEP
jgi:DNA-binding FadR family transcriptional regulator